MFERNGDRLFDRQCVDLQLLALRGGAMGDAEKNAEYDDGYCLHVLESICLCQNSMPETDGPYLIASTPSWSTAGAWPSSVFKTRLNRSSKTV